MLAALGRSVTSIADAVRRLVAPPLPLSVGVGGTSSTYTASEFDPQRAMSAMAGYPWARVGIQAIATDLAGLPIVAKRNGELIGEHWLVDLLRRPDRHWSGVRWRRQIVADLAATGNCYARIYRTATGQPYRLRRLHPGRMTVIVERDELAGWLYNGVTRLDLDEVWHVADISWRDDAGLEHLGESPLRPLAVSIRAAIDARSQAGRGAKRGRLEMILKAPNNTILGPDAVDRIKEAYTDSASRGDGVVVVSQGLEAIPVGLSPRDTEWSDLDTRTRDETLAIFGVPPVRAQLPTANYGAAKQEMRQYWEGRLLFVQLIDAELSELAAEEGVTISHSFESVEALQTAYTERLDRVVTWESLGADAYTAAKHEGFLVPPLTPGAAPPAPTTPLVFDDPEDDPPAPSPITEALRAAAAFVDGAVEAYGDDIIPTGEIMALAPEVADVLRSVLKDRADAVAEELLASTIDAWRDHGVVSCAEMPVYGERFAAALAAEVEHGS